MLIMKKLPGIFNDVTGPVMRGPSSSHTAASWRIAKISMDILNDKLQKALIEFDRDGAWAPNYREQGTTMGIDGGLLGLDITDERMKDTDQYAREKGIEIEYRVSSFPTDHANTARLTLWGVTNKKVQIVAVSTGGGSFEIRSVDGFEVQLNGDLYGMIFFSGNKPEITEDIEKIIPANVKLTLHRSEDSCMYLFRSSYPFAGELISQIENHPSVDEVALINPVMPVISGRETVMPFTSIKSLQEYAVQTGADLGKIGMIYEMCLSGLSEDDLHQKMANIVDTIEKSINTGLKGTHYKDRILQQQSHLIAKAERDGRIKGSVINNIVANVTALMESKSSMEVIVATPTAGSCGTLGGTLSAVAENTGSGNNEMVSAFFAAGIVGAYFAQGPGFSAEEHGCQVECGAASGMTAAALVQLMGGTAKQALAAASMSIQNMIGLVCDPVADRVEVPCLGKNVSAAVNAYSSAIMAISGYDEVIPLDEVISTVSEVSKTMPVCVKCTGKGGLAITETSKRIKESLKDQ